MFFTRYSIFGILLHTSNIFVFFRFLYFYYLSSLRFFKRFQRKLVSLKLFIESYWGYKYSDFQDAFACASLFLILIKIISYFFITFSPIINFILLIIFFSLSIKFRISVKIRKQIYLFLVNNLGPYFIGFQEGTWEEMLDDVKEGVLSMPMFDDKVPIDFWYHKVLRVFCYLLIYIRLWIYSELFFYIIFRNLFFYFLFFNQLLFVHYILSLFIISSRFLLLMKEKEYKIFKHRLSGYNVEIRKINKSIKPTKNSAIFIFCWITRDFELDDETWDYNSSFEWREEHIDSYLTETFNTCPMDNRLININFPVYYRASYLMEEDYYYIKNNNQYFFYFLKGMVFVFVLL